MDRRDFIKKTGLATILAATKPSDIAAAITQKENHDLKINIYVDPTFLQKIPEISIQWAMQTTRRFYENIGLQTEYPGINITYNLKGNINELSFEMPEQNEINLAYITMDTIREVPLEKLIRGVAGEEKAREYMEARKQIEKIPSLSYLDALDDYLIDKLDNGGTSLDKINTILITPYKDIQRHDIRKQDVQQAIGTQYGITLSHEIGHILGLEHTKESPNLMSSNKYPEQMNRFLLGQPLLNKEQIKKINEYFRN